ncbi:MAG: DUF3300 domain-containing protein [Deltaproteobacteria bacterium]|nr:DUF3300 domain-containing protein [Deltaproteobacteria bacterium]
MKAANIFYRLTGLFIIFLLSLPLPGYAQDTEEEEPPQLFTREQLAQMLAPIALYPDALLSQVLMAATYPIEVVEADRWLKKNSQLQGEGLDDALENEDFDPSVKSLCHFPSILALMSERISETTNLGNAFLAQETEVMAMVQELRLKAHEQGNLTSTPEQKVIVEKETIIIEPAKPEVVYVPYYDPLYVYGPWWYPYYEPYYWGPGPVVSGAGIYYWSGPHVSYGAISWSYFDWRSRYIYIDAHRHPRYFRHHDRETIPDHWRHAPRHRRGVAYHDKPTARRYGQSPAFQRENRRDDRGIPEKRDMDRGDRDGREQRGDSRDRDRADRDQQERVRPGQDNRERQHIDPEKQTQPKPDQDNRERQRIEPEKQTPPEPGQESRERQRIEPEKQAQPEPGQESRERQRIDPEKQTPLKPGQENRERQRIAPEKQEQPEPDQDSRERQRIDREKQERARTDQDNRERQRIDRESREKARSAQELQERERVDREKQERARIDQDNRERQRIEAENREKARAVQEMQERERIEREKQEQAKGSQTKPAKKGGDHTDGAQDEEIEETDGTPLGGAGAGREENNSSKRGRSGRGGQGSSGDAEGGRFDRGRMGR